MRQGALARAQIDAGDPTSQRVPFPSRSRTACSSQGSRNGQHAFDSAAKSVTISISREADVRGQRNCAWASSTRYTLLSSRAGHRAIRLDRSPRYGTGGAVEARSRGS